MAEHAAHPRPARTEPQPARHARARDLRHHHARRDRRRARGAGQGARRRARVLPVEPRGRADRPHPGGAELGRRHPDQPRRPDAHECRAARRAGRRSSCRSSRCTSRTSSRARPSATTRYVSPIAVGVVAGFGPASYRLGLEALLDALVALTGRDPRDLAQGRCRAQATSRAPAAGQPIGWRERRTSPACALLSDQAAALGGSGQAKDPRKSAQSTRRRGPRTRRSRSTSTLVKLDPKDSKLRLEIGDAYRRWGQVDEAIDSYLKVADQYMREGFDARAVAVYKQISKLDPKRHGAYEPLAELYERMGLTSEAIGALQTAADGYHKQAQEARGARAAAQDGDDRSDQHHEPDQGRRAAAPGEAARRRRSPSTSRSPPSSSGRATSTPPERLAHARARADRATRCSRSGAEAAPRTRARGARARGARDRR